MHDGKMRKDILYADFVLRESARQASAPTYGARLKSEIRRHVKKHKLRYEKNIFFVSYVALYPAPVVRYILLLCSRCRYNYR